MGRKRQKAMNAYLGKFKEREMEDAAVLTLEQLNYTYHGGQLWKPPIGQKPDWVDEDKAVQDHELDGSEAVEWQPGDDCMVPHPASKGVKAKIVHVSSDRAWVKCESGTRDRIVELSQVRHIKSPKEKAIEEMLEIIMSSSGHAAGLIECINVAKAMYEEGYHK